MVKHKKRKDIQMDRQKERKGRTFGQMKQKKTDGWINRNIEKKD